MRSLGKLAEVISIHALRGEGDVRSFGYTAARPEPFQSTPSVGRATYHEPPFANKEIISIHALRGEGDTPSTELRNNALISIHALRGEGDTIDIITIAIEKVFQSTPSVGRATAKIYKYAMLCLYIVHIKLYIFATAVLFT